MPASHGKNGRVFVNGYDISTYLNSFGFDWNIGTTEVTSFLSSAKTYITGQADGTSSGEGFWDGAIGAIDEILAEIKRSEAVWSYYPGDSASGSRGYGFKALRSAYSTQNTLDNAIRFSVASQASGGGENILSIGGSTTKSASGSSTVLDLGASGAGSNGASIYFHATAVSGTVGVVVEHSTNNSTWTTLATLSNVSAIGAQKVVTTGAVNRYIRITVTLDAGESITFQAGVHVN